MDHFEPGISLLARRSQRRALQVEEQWASALTIQSAAASFLRQRARPTTERRRLPSAPQAVHRTSFAESWPCV
eukprot:6193709-Pleurochrysis_carterae.AAC.2